MFEVNSNSVRFRIFRANDVAYLDKNQTADDAKNGDKKTVSQINQKNEYFIARSIEENVSNHVMHHAKTSGTNESMI